MTEEEWLACEDSRTMLEFIRPRTSNRKLRLFAAACFRRLTRILSDPRQLQAIEALENNLEMTEVPRAIVKIAHHALPPSEHSLSGNYAGQDDPFYVSMLLFRELVSSSIASHATVAADVLADPVGEQREQCRLLRCLFGPLPFHAVSIDSDWRSPAIVDLARAIYQEKAFELLPALAEALEKAGCHDTEVLNHCREPGPHARGCWVIDLLLHADNADVSQTPIERPNVVSPCPYCGKPLRTDLAKQCLECGADWHNPDNVVWHGNQRAAISERREQPDGQ